MQPAAEKRQGKCQLLCFYAVMEASNFLVKRPINEFMRASCLTVQQFCGHAFTQTALYLATCPCQTKPNQTKETITIATG